MKPKPAPDRAQAGTAPAQVPRLAPGEVVEGGVGLVKIVGLGTS